MKETLKALYTALHKLLLIQENLDLTLGDKQMDQSVTDVLKAIDDATNAIAARIASLVANAPLSPEVKAAFQTEIDKLNELGKTVPSV